MSRGVKSSFKHNFKPGDLAASICDDCPILIVSIEKRKGTTDLAWVKNYKFRQYDGFTTDGYQHGLDVMNIIHYDKWLFKLMYEQNRKGSFAIALLNASVKVE